MRNRWGVEVKRGHWITAHLPRGGSVEGKVSKVAREAGRGYVVTLESGITVGLDDVAQTLGPMTVGADGVVTQNPLMRVEVTSPMQRPHKSPRTGKPTTKPGARQLARRAKTAKTKTRGVYANPAPHSFPWLVETQHKPGSWGVRANFASKAAAVAYAHALADASSKDVRIRKAGTPAPSST